MHRPRFGLILLAVAIATAGAIPLFAAPAGAATTCNGAGPPAVTGGEFPNIAGSQSVWKVNCTTAAASKIDSANVADGGNGYWHRGAARSATVTTAANSANITYAAGHITSADIKRPISGGCIAGGAFIKTAGATSGTLSAASGATGCGATTATVEYTNSRVIKDASCTTAGVVTSTSALFAAADVGKSVSGGPFKAGARIQSVSGSTATVKLAAGAAANTAVCTAPDTLTIGAATYSPATSTTVVWSSDPMAVELQNSTANGQAFSCTGSVLTELAGAIADGQNFSTSYAGLKVVVKGASATVATKVNSATTTALTLANPCPAGVAAAVGTAAIGQPGANAPKPGNTMASLAAELNLNPVLVATQDDCNLNTFEGFQVIGTWNNPLTAAGTAFGYATTGVIGGATLVSTGQILFPTSVVSFSAYIRPQRTAGLAGGAPAGSHFEFAFPSLPTSLAVCLTGANPTNATALSFTINPTVLSVSPSLPTGGGNPADPSIRALGPQTGATHGQYQLKNGTTVVATGALATCTVVANTATPAYGCGDG